MRAYSITGIARALLHKGQPEAALPLAEQARLAEAIWRLGKDRPRARELIKQAKDAFQKIGRRQGVEKADRWLAAHVLNR